MVSLGGLSVFPLVLSPMAGYTDHPFRLICREQGAGMVCTELLSAAAMWYGSRRTEQMLAFTDAERPVGIQIFGGDPEQMANAARFVTEHHPDFVDINLGCSVQKVIKTGACSALTLHPEQLRAVLTAVVSSTHLPVTAKLRAGWEEGDESATWVSEMCEEVGLKAVTVHGRYARQGFTGHADWDVVARVKRSVGIPVFGSGDLRTPEDVVRRMEQTGCDGVMAARGAMGNPWFFARAKALMEGVPPPPEPTPIERIEMIRRHIGLNVADKGERLGVVSFRSHVAAYCKGIPAGNRLRDALMRLPTLDGVYSELDRFRKEMV